MREGVQLLLDNGTIKITGQRDDYHEIDMVEVCLLSRPSRIFYYEGGCSIVVKQWNYQDYMSER